MNNKQQWKHDNSLYRGILEGLLYDFEILTKRPKEYEIRSVTERYYTENISKMLGFCDNIKAFLLNIQKELENGE